METPIKEFEVTGVSRSGRVRKKSSKLLDFQSPDEVENKPKRATKTPGRGTRGRPPLSKKSWKQRSVVGTPTALDDGCTDEELGSEQERLLLEGNQTPAAEIEVDKNLTASIPTGDNDQDELDELVAGIVEGVAAEQAGDSKVRQSLYMTEKANQKKVLKDGRVVSGKVQRKDKGKPRFTAYSLWAREFRKSSKFGTKQDLDFAGTARRLSELWANVPNNEKNIWRRKAKRLASKANQEEATAAGSTNAAAASSSTFLNRATTSRTKKLAAEKEKPHHERHKNSTSSSHKQSHIKVPLSDIEPIDAAAHLKLLGESLSIIGERLKEHEGQITVSGSLSVLLDSLLCSLGPLLCLTTRIPGLGKRKDLRENLTATLDNIAYVMPGL